MRIRVKVVAHASRDAIEKLAEESFKVWVREVPVRGKANEAVMRLLSLEFGVPVSKVRLISGTTSSQKIFQIE